VRTARPGSPPSPGRPAGPRSCRPHRGLLISSLGFASILFPFPLAPLVGLLGSRDLQKIRAGRLDPEGEALTSGRAAGRQGRNERSRDSVPGQPGVSLLTLSIIGTRHPALAAVETLGERQAPAIGLTVSPCLPHTGFCRPSMPGRPARG